MQNDQTTHVPRHERFVHHPIHAMKEEAAHVRQVAEEGESPATPAILVGAVMAFIFPFATLLIFLGFVVARFA